MFLGRGGDFLRIRVPPIFAFIIIPSGLHYGNLTQGAGKGMGVI